MKFYFAPMEGVTGYIYRNVHHAMFSSVDKYFTPFVVANQHASMKSKERNDLLPEHNQGIQLVPQILTNNAEDFIAMSKKIKEFGYDEINLNLGCPSGTVVAKKKGAGFLAYQTELNQFLDKIFEANVTKISVKTRIGKNSPEEFEELLELFNRYPMEELIIHPRVQLDYYKNKPNMEKFKVAYEQSNNIVCYNGDLNSVAKIEKFVKEYNKVDRIMIGRGLLFNPCLINEWKGTQILTKAILREFHDRILEEYQKVLFGDKNILFKMKELWFYMCPLFTNYETYAKKLRKCDKLCVYHSIVNDLFQNEGFRKDLHS